MNISDKMIEIFANSHRPIKYWLMDHNTLSELKRECARDYSVYDPSSKEDKFMGIPIFVPSRYNEELNLLEGVYE